jgi:hypothetical protein
MSLRTTRLKTSELIDHVPTAAGMNATAAKEAVEAVSVKHRFAFR